MFYCIYTVREGLKQLEDLKLRFENEYHMKEKEVYVITHYIFHLCEKSVLNLYYCMVLL